MSDVTDVPTVQHHIRLKTNATPIPVDAISPHPGLFVFQMPAEHVKTPGMEWRVGHACGLAIAAAANARDALYVADTIADFTDWTQTEEQLLANISGELLWVLRDLIELETPGVQLPR